MISVGTPTKPNNWQTSGSLTTPRRTERVLWLRRLQAQLCVTQLLVLRQFRSIRVSARDWRWLASSSLLRTQHVMNANCNSKKWASLHVSPCCKLRLSCISLQIAHNCIEISIESPSLKTLLRIDRNIPKPFATKSTWNLRGQKKPYANVNTVHVKLKMPRHVN